MGGERDLVDPFPGEFSFFGPQVFSVSQSFGCVWASSWPVLSPSWLQKIMVLRLIVLLFVVSSTFSRCPVVVFCVPGLAFV